MRLPQMRFKLRRVTVALAVVSVSLYGIWVIWGLQRGRPIERLQYSEDSTPSKRPLKIVKDESTEKPAGPDGTGASEVRSNAETIDVFLIQLIANPERYRGKLLRVIGANALRNNYVPNEGYVPNKDVAIKIAVAAWEPIYGELTIALEQPFRAELDGEVWTVTGTLHGGPEVKGGVALAQISKKDGRIIRITHGR
jgi:NTF2 fold immunity protein